MPRPKSDLTTHKINLHGGDFEKMREMFPVKGPSIAIRNLVRAFLTKNYKPANRGNFETDIDISDIE